MPNKTKRNPAPCSQASLMAALTYHPETGKFYWNKSGKVAGSDRDTGYRAIRIMGALHYAHRLAWLYMTGEWPAQDIDHANGERADNRFCNLRAASIAENRRNAKPCKNKRHPVKGGSPYKYGYRSFIRINGKAVALGTFKTPEAAHAAYAQAAKKHYGEFARS